MAWSNRWYSPVQALSCIPSKCSSVDLPAPDGPMMETNSPSLISALMRRRTKVLVGPCSKYFSTFRRTIRGELICIYIRLWGRAEIGSECTVPESKIKKGEDVLGGGTRVDVYQGVLEVNGIAEVGHSQRGQPGEG